MIPIKFKSYFFSLSIFSLLKVVANGINLNLFLYISFNLRDKWWCEKTKFIFSSLINLSFSFRLAYSLFKNMTTGIFGFVLITFEYSLKWNFSESDKTE